jgi:hypothetical protein
VVFILPFKIKFVAKPRINAFLGALSLPNFLPLFLCRIIIYPF